MTLYEVWTSIQNTLVENAETIGIPADQISKGDFQKKLPVKPPAIVINFEPGDFVFGSDPNMQTATMTIFFLTRPATAKTEEIAKAISDAIALGWRAFRILRTSVPGIRYRQGGTPPIELDTVQGDLVATAFRATVPFTP